MGQNSKVGTKAVLFLRDKTQFSNLTPVDYICSRNN